MNEETDPEEVMRSIWRINDVLTYDTIKNAPTEVTVEYRGETIVVVGELEFRFVGPGEDQYAPRFQGAFYPSGSGSEVRLLMDLDLQELLALDVLPDSSEVRFRMTPVVSLR